MQLKGKNITPQCRIIPASSVGFKYRKIKSYCWEPLEILSYRNVSFKTALLSGFISSLAMKKNQPTFPSSLSSSVLCIGRHFGPISSHLTLHLVPYYKVVLLGDYFWRLSTPCKSWGTGAELHNFYLPFQG